ncbi:MAG: hypothetical protein AAF389_00655 [Gemmatimonadota bacterium]
MTVALFAVAVGFVEPVQGQSADEGGAPVCESGPISRIVLDRRTVYDPESTTVGALAWTYRLLNVLHIKTAESFIRRELLFEEGDCLDPFFLDESARLLESYGFIGYATIESESDGDGGHVVHVQTQDEWSTQVDIGVTYDNSDFNLEKFEVTEENFLGQGIFAEFTHAERREARTQGIGLATPRFFGRADASIRVGRDRPGDFISQHLRYPFIGETGKYAIRQGYDRSTRFFSYTTDGQEAFTQVLVPSFRDLFELSFARRFGERYRSVIAGVSFTRDVIRFPRLPNVIFADDFGDLRDFPGALPGPLAAHFQESGASRIALHIGTRRFNYVLFEGIEGNRDRMRIGLGVYAGLSIGRSFDVFVPSDVPAVSDYFGRAHATFSAAVGSSLLHGGATLETRRDRGAWRDVLFDADFVAFLNSDQLPGQTFFLRTQFGGGWNTELPFQLSLGGREGVRSLEEDQFPGGRMVRVVLEDRVLFPWPSRGSVDLGMTAFIDVGRVWPGDVPYGVDSGWQKALGIGLRFGLPSGTRHVFRTDVAFPVGSAADGPRFRAMFELNMLSLGFFTPDVFRSRRYNIGAEHF